MKSFGLIAIIGFLLMSDNVVTKAQSDALSVSQIELMSKTLGIWKTVGLINKKSVAFCE